MLGCDPLIEYESTDEREVVTVTIKNHNIYFLCSSKLNGFIDFYNSEASSSK